MYGKSFFQKLNLSLLLLLFFLFFTFPAYSGKSVTRAEYVMGTILEISIKNASRKLANLAINDSFREVRRLDNIMSQYKESSQLSKINWQSGKKWVKVNNDLFKLLKSSIMISKLTNGAFDISIGPLIDYWASASKRNKKVNKTANIPKSTDIVRLSDQQYQARFTQRDSGVHLARDKVSMGKNLFTLLSLVNYKNIMLNPELESVFLKVPKMKLDLGGIAKGYAMAKVLAILNKYHINNVKINFGTSLYWLASSSKGKTQNLRLRNPLNKDEVLLTLNVNNLAVSTSAGYERFFQIGGKKYSHIINPKNGLPVVKVLSATVIAVDPTRADALSTALSVMPIDKGIPLINRLKGIEAILVLAGVTGSKILVTNGLKNKVKMNNNNNRR